MSGGRDELYADPRTRIEAFSFDRHVATVFDDMILRSVPGYATVVAMTGVLAGEYAQPDSRCYDLGCSLGATTLAMRRQVHVPGCRVVGVDNAPAMIAGCREKLRAAAALQDVDLVCADIRDILVRDASVVALNFTIQFVPPAERKPMLQRVYDGLRPGGLLVMSEKVAFADADLEGLMTGLHHAFKRANGYSALEIAQKRAALERVLVPETLETHADRLRSIGFSRVTPWLQCLNFVSLLATR